MAVSPSGSNSDVALGIQGIHHVGVSVPDLAKARDKAKQFEDELLHGDSGTDSDSGDSAE